MISGELDRGIDATRVVFDQTSGYRNGPGQEWVVPIWEFVSDVATRTTPSGRRR